MTQHAIGSLVEMLGVEKGLTVLNFFTAMENPDMVRRQLRASPNRGQVELKPAMNHGILLKDC